MKKIILSTVLVLSAVTASPAMSAEQTIKLSVPGMTCASCPFIVKKAVSAIEGVKAVEATMEDFSATVTFEDTLTSIQAIQQATADIGYPSSLFGVKSGS